MRALRVGVVLGDNIVEERVFVEGPVTIGQSLRCQLSVPVDGVPLAHVLFVRDQGRWMVRTLDGRVTPAEERGKLQIGEATILYQAVAAPVATPRPQLPASVRGTFADRIDRRLAVIIGGSLVVHIAIGSWAWLTETEQPSMITRTAALEYHQDTYRIEVPDPVAPTAPEPGPQQPGAAAPVTPAQTSKPIVQRPRPAPTELTQMTTSDAERFAQMLTTDRVETAGRTEMESRMPGAELGKQIADIRENGRTIGNETGGFRNRDREGLGDGTEIARAEPRQLETQRPRDERTPSRVQIQPGPRPGGGPDPAGIIARIQGQYMQGLLRCYQQGLRVDASLRGKVAVAFTVTETGKLADGSARGVSTDVDACISAQMASWRFPVQRDADGAATDIDIQLSLALVPGT